MEDMKNKVSVITICHNCLTDFEKTVKSVAAQTYGNVEYIIVDGDSTDGTKEMIGRYRHAIDKWVSEPDDGIYDAINKGVRMATGEWIICMNAGDTFASDDILANIFSKEIPDGKTFLYSDFILDHEDGKTEYRVCDRTKGDIHHQNAIYRRSLHERFGYYIVTHPYIVSDLLFFLAIPQEEYLKLPTPIANVKAGGISCQLWASEQAWAAKVVYGMDSITGIFLKDLRLRFGLWRQRMKKRCTAFLKKENKA